MEEIEIEKRYKISLEKANEILKGAEYISVVMDDYYVPNGREHMDLRVRRKDCDCCITRKTPITEDGTTIMKEVTIPINTVEFELLTDGIKTSVKKERFFVEYNGKKADLDIFKGRHKGLCIIEFEFASEKEMNDWLANADMSELEDVTADKSLAGGKLAEI